MKSVESDTLFKTWYHRSPEHDEDDEYLNNSRLVSSIGDTRPRLRSGRSGGWSLQLSIHIYCTFWLCTAFERASCTRGPLLSPNIAALLHLVSSPSYPTPYAPRAASEGLCGHIEGPDAIWAGDGVGNGQSLVSGLYLH